MWGSSPCGSVSSYSCNFDSSEENTPYGQCTCLVELINDLLSVLNVHVLVHPHRLLLLENMSCYMFKQVLMMECLDMHSKLHHLRSYSFNILF